MKSIEKILGDNIREERTTRRWSQNQLAEFCGVDQPTIQRWEKGKTWPQPKYVKKLAEVFHIDETDLFKSNEKQVYPSLQESLKVICHELGYEIQPLKKEI